MIKNTLLFFLAFSPLIAFSQVEQKTSAKTPTVYLIGVVHDKHFDPKSHYSIVDLQSQIIALKPDLVCGEITPEAFDAPMEGYFPPEAAMLAEMAEELNYRFVPVDWRIDHTTQT